MKKKKTISRLLALTLSILLVMSISAVTAFAEADFLLSVSYSPESEQTALQPEYGAEQAGRTGPG